MSILTLTANEPISPIGIILIVGFIIIFVVCLNMDKKSNKKFLKEIEEKYPSKDSFDRAYVTEKGELLFSYGSGTLSGYKLWNLQEIGYIATYRGEFTLQDRNKQSMKGEYLTPSQKKVLKEMSYASFNVGQGYINGYVEFIMKHGSHIQHIVGGKVQE